MTACGSCGRPARPLALILLAAPIVAGAPAAALVVAARGTEHERAGILAGGAVIAAVAAGLLWFALRVVRGRACPGCGRGR